MFRILFLVTRGWKLLPRRHRRRVLVGAALAAKRHGPAAVRVARTHGPKVAGAVSRARAATRRPR